MLEGDSTCICNAFQEMGEAWSSVQNIVSRTIHLAQAFGSIAFSHTKRLRNVLLTCWLNMQPIQKTTLHGQRSILVTQSLHVLMMFPLLRIMNKMSSLLIKKNLNRNLLLVNAKNLETYHTPTTSRTLIQSTICIRVIPINPKQIKKKSSKLYTHQESTVLKSHTRYEHKNNK